MEPMLVLTAVALGLVAWGLLDIRGFERLCNDVAVWIVLKLGIAP